MSFEYNSGFGNEFETEALEGALPQGQNSPQQCRYGLYAEQLSGSAFTAPRGQNMRSWLYKIRPSAHHLPFTSAKTPEHLVSVFSEAPGTPNISITPNQTRWSPFESADIMSRKVNATFMQGLFTICGAGAPSTRTGLATHIYIFNDNMKNEAFYNADGDYLLVPQDGKLEIQTEMGWIALEPKEIAVIPRGIKFKVVGEALPDGKPKICRGYVLEIYDRHFELPDLGPIGSNGCASPRDFLYPKAAFEDVDAEFTITTKYLGQYFNVKQDHSPFDVVAWHGNYSPYKYDLRKFVPVGAVLKDHLDPSIFTVLTCKSANPGVALADFVIFPPRYAVQEHTFRPPYFHRNCMSEFMGLISGSYEAKQEGFLPGGGSLHSMMSAHGPDAATFEKESSKQLAPERLPDHALAFMFESSMFLLTTKWAMSPKEDGGKMIQQDYYNCWHGLQKHFHK